MILLFPDLDTLRLALTGGHRAAGRDARPGRGRASTTTGGSTSRPTRSCPKTVTENLDRLGVNGRSGTPATRRAGLLLAADPAGCPRPGPAAALDPGPGPVRTGVGRGPAGARRRRCSASATTGRVPLAAPTARHDRRVLLRVIGPPYYTLLRALDQTAGGTEGAVRAYLEQAPRVWVEVGHTHPLAAQVKLADGQLLLIRPPREWIYLPDAAVPGRVRHHPVQSCRPTRSDWTEATGRRRR